MSSEENRRLALIVACDRYEDPKLKELKAPSQDAERFAKILKDPKIGGFKVTTLINQPYWAVKESINEFIDSCSRGDTILLYFSCHGIKDKNGRLYFATKTTNRKKLLSTGIGSNFVNEALDECRAQQKVVLLDCCYSGAFEKGRFVRGDYEVNASEQIGKGSVIITASNAMQYAFEGDDKIEFPRGASYFTNALIEGLESGAADDNYDGKITYQELYDYLHKRVREYTRDQTPTLSAQDVEGDFVIFKSTREMPHDLKLVQKEHRIAESETDYSNFRSENEQLSPKTLDDMTWEYLLEGIKLGKCTPFIGERSCFPSLPSGEAIADQWANEERSLHTSNYGRLTKIAQYLASRYGEMYPKNKIIDLFKKAQKPDFFHERDEPHTVLADLGMPLYITTNFDDFMFQCLKSRRRYPVQDYLHWNAVPEVMRKSDHNEDESFEPTKDKSFEPTKDHPLVYYLCGHIKAPNSILLTESDYENYNEFIIRSRYDNSIDPLPPSVRLTMISSVLLFVGYTIEDWKFDVLLNWINSFMYLGRSNYLKVLVHPFHKGKKTYQEQEEYLHEYFKKEKLGQASIYWGSVRDFMHELRERWENYRREAPSG